jgi:hypothetical protein
MFGSRRQVTGTGSDHSVVAGNPHGSTFQQAWLYSSERKQSKESFRLDACHDSSNLIGMCRNYDVRDIGRSFACCSEVSHVIYSDFVNQRSKKVAQTGNHGLFGTGWGV